MSHALGTRPAAVAGLFYPANPDELRRSVCSYLSRDAGAPTAPLRALVCPHAGYIYSGPVAGFAYRALLDATLRGQRFERVAILAPAHRVAFEGIAVPTFEHFATPFGKVRLWSGCRQLAQQSPFLAFDEPHQAEHAIEVQLPFLQHVLGDFELVPLLFGGHASHQTEPTVLEALSSLTNENTLLIVSTDLSHYLPYDQARATDARTLQALLDLDSDRTACSEACGRGPAATMVTYARARGLQVSLLDYRTSGDTAGDKGKVVGYAALCLTDPTGA